ncbi:MAG: hypothetical protein WC882_05410 [Candidatus Gracilibacteria bacterium]
MKNISKNALKLLAVLIGIFAVSGIALASSAWPCSSTLTNINGGSGTVTEPSDALVYGGYLWIVSDDGYLWRMGLDGTGKISSYLGGDFEGLTQKDGYLYVVNEYPAIVYKVTPNTSTSATSAGSLTGSYWNLSDTSLTYPITTTSTSAGVEAMTTDGTNFYLGMQDDGDVYIYNSSFTYLNKLTTPHAGYTDLAGLYYQDGTFYALFDSNLRIVLFTVNSTTAPTSFTELKNGAAEDVRYQTPDANWEGLAFNGTDLYVADDGGYIYKFTGFPTITTTAAAPAAEETAEPAAAEPVVAEPAAPDYTTISSATIIRSPKTISVVYASGDTQSITYTAAYSRVRTGITSDSHALLVLDWRTLYIYMNGVCVLTWSI